MASAAGRAAAQVGKVAGSAARQAQENTVLKKGARRDPELYVR